MKREELLAKAIDNDFQDDGYFENIDPPWLGQEDESIFVADSVPEMPRAIRVMDFEIGLSDDEIDNWEDYMAADIDKMGHDQGAKNRGGAPAPAADAEKATLNIFAQSVQPYNHEEYSVWDACGITSESYRHFCDAWKTTVGAARAQEPRKQSREIEAFEKLMMPYPREVAFYITQLISDLSEFDYLRSVLRRLLREPRKEAAKEEDLENLEFAGSA